MFPLVDEAKSNLTLALRGFRATPTVVAVAILSLALGIGANTAIFSILDSLLLRQLPVKGPGQLALVTDDSPSHVRVWSYPVWVQIRDRPELFEASAAWSFTQFNLASGGETEFVDGMWASGSIFETLGVTPLLGRGFTSLDDRPGGGLTPVGFDLPLFNDGRDDVPLVSGNTPPRPPLAVRRGAPAAPRPRVEDVRPEPALEFAEPASDEPGDGRHLEPQPRALGVVDTEAIASSGPRLLGAAIDAIIIGSIDTAVLYFTLKLCGLPFSGIRALPVVPMLGFLLLLNGGYVTIFTPAGGPTIAKLLAGPRVGPAAPADGPRRLSFGTALVRAAACLVSLLPAGAGFFMAIFRADGRALHDAVADTRVIKA